MSDSSQPVANDLIEVVPGLMIWTLIAFGITFFVLKRFAFGPIQKTIDERRDRIRAAVDEADKARDEARELLEQHRAAHRRGEGQTPPTILAEARKVADAQIERVKEEAEIERQRRLEETRGRSTRRRSARSTDPLRGRRPDARGDGTRHRQGARRGGSAAPDRRGDLRARLLGAGAERG